MSTTVTAPAINGKVFADEPPTRIREVLEAYVEADRGLFLDKRAYSRHPIDSNAEQVIESGRHRDAAEAQAERVLDDHFSYRPDAMWPIRGKLVGFSAVSKYGMRLRITAASSDLNKRGTR